MSQNISSSRLLSSRSIGFLLLIIVNILWVLSSEVTRYIFVDEQFRRPIFASCLRMSVLAVYIVRYFIQRRRKLNANYATLVNESSSGESIPMGRVTDSLSVEGFETISSLESDSELERPEREPSVQSLKSVRFAPRREIRRLPSAEADAAQRARLPYSGSPICADSKCSMSLEMKCTLFVFAPLWLLCSFSYQASLMFTSVTSLNLISSSSSLFVLVFSICVPSKSSSFSLAKAGLVALNLFGIFIISEFDASASAVVLATTSAIAYAVYLTLYARYQQNNGDIDMNLMFGTIGCIAILLGGPSLLLLDKIGVESMYPPATQEQLLSILLSALVGTLLGDYLWLVGASMTDSLSASMSLTLAIPLSFLADAIFRDVMPTTTQLVSAVPITASFIGAILVDRPKEPTVTGAQEEDSHALLDDDDNDDE